MKTVKKIIFELLPLLVLLGILGGIQAAIQFFKIPKYVLPSPFAALRYIFVNLNVMLPHIWKSVLQFLIGFPLGALIGVTFALIFTVNKVLNKAVSPYLMIIICTPQLVMVPLLKMWMGFGVMVCVVAGALSCFGIIMMNTMAGVSMVPVERIELMQSFKANKWQTFYKVIIPSSLPSVFTGLKLGCIFSLTGIIGAEMIGDLRGMGAMIVIATDLYSMEEMFAYIFLLMFFAYIFYSGICAFESRLVKEE